MKKLKYLMEMHEMRAYCHYRRMSMEMIYIHAHLYHCKYSMRKPNTVFLTVFREEGPSIGESTGR